VLLAFAPIGMPAQDYRHKDLVDQYKFDDTSFFKSEVPSLEKELLVAKGKDKVIAHLAMAQVLSSRQLYSRALANYFAALSLAGRLNNRQVLFLCYFKLATYYYITKASYSTTIKYLYTARKLYQGNKQDLAYFNLLRRIAFIEIETENDHLAEKTYFELISLLPFIDKKTDVSFIYNNLATIYISTHQFEAAQNNLDKTLHLTLKSGDSTAIARCYVNYGNLYREKKEFTKALPYYEKALRIQTNNNLESNSMECTVYMGMCNKSMGRTALAIQQLKTAFDYCEKSKNDALNEMLLPHLAGCYAEVNQHTLAYKAQKRLYDLQQLIGSKGEKEAIRKYNSEYAFEKKLIEDSLRYSKKALEAEFESEKKMTLNNEKNKRNILIVSFCLLLVLVVGAIIYVTQKQKNRLRLKISEVKALQAQMNPHFIFNSLNSVLEFISKSQTSEAIKYLTRFSRLIRMVLEFSNRRSILLSEELEMLRLYIDLENIRAEVPFTYTIDVDKNLDESNTEVPPMLLQPFVENSIIHGILNKAKLAELTGSEYRGDLKITLSVQGEMLRCTVQDNGVGLEKALEIKAGKSFNHHSLGMRITKDRLDLIGAHTGKIEYFDLKDEAGQVQGTRVEILVPLTETL